LKPVYDQSQSSGKAEHDEVVALGGLHILGTDATKRAGLTISCAARRRRAIPALRVFSFARRRLMAFSAASASRR